MPFIADTQLAGSKNDFIAEPQTTADTLPNPAPGKSAGLQIGENQYVQKTTKKTGVFSRLVNDVKSISSQAKERFSKAQEAIARQKEGKQNILDTVFQVGGQAAGLGSDVIQTGINEGLTTAYKALTPVNVQNADREQIAKISNDLASSPTGQQALGAIQEVAKEFNSFKQTHPKEAANLSAAGNYIDFLSNFVGVGEGVKAGEIGIKATESGLKTAGELAKVGTEGLGKAASSIIGSGGEAIKAGGELVSKIAPTLEGAKTVIGENLRGVGTALSEAPARLATNATAQKTERLALEQLPKEAQSAVKSGVLARDAQLIAEPATKEEKNVFNQMVTDAEQFGKTRSAKDPALVAGKVVTKRIEDLGKIVENQGKKLGELVKTIPKEKVKGIFDAAITRLRATPGLENLSVSPKGILDFAHTKLALPAFKSDKKAIQEAWTAMYGRGGREMHSLRQELFSLIQKQIRSPEGLTDLADQGINAIRRGISDGLDAVSSGYKTLNQQYAKVIGPYENAEKLFTKLKGMGEDITSERGAALLRQLSSRSKAAPEIRGLFGEIDKALLAAGKKPGANLQKIQDFYDALQRTFDITKDQTLKGQVGIEGIPTSIRGAADKAFGAIIEKVGVSPAVKQKAFKDLVRFYHGK